jgi:hypothetical protein
MKYQSIIGREEEIATLERLYKSQKSEFIAIYGRRRVGKSYLVNEVYGRKIVFTAVGTYLKVNDEDIDDKKVYETYRRIQLDHFYDALLLAGLSEQEAKPNCWREAFLLLRKLLSGMRTRRKVVVIDELPWLAGPQSSELISELGYFWNSWAGSQRNIVMVVLGSATSWMLDNVIDDYGGLHGRLTEKIKLRPFTLAECERYYKKHRFRLSRYEMCIGYMALGGIPYYLDKLRNDQTMTENLDRIFFADEKIHQEFIDVYAGLYQSRERYVDIVKALGGQFYGMTQKEIVDAVGVKSGGTLSKHLENLLESGVVRKYPRYGKERVEQVYQLMDFFTLFYLKFVHGHPVRKGMWSSIHGTSVFYTWAGDTFELLSIHHLEQLQDTLRIASVDRSYCWSGTAPDGRNAQIDLVMESKASRTDFLCEMKFSMGRFSVKLDDETDFLHKISAFEASKMHKPSQSIQLVLVTTFGLAHGEHSGVVHRVVTLEELFK